MGYTNLNLTPDFGSGAKGLIYLGKRFRLGAEVEYNNVSFTRQYNFLNPEATSIDRTKMAIHNLAVNPNLDFRFFTIGKLDVYASTGLQLEFTLTDYQRTFLMNGDKLTSKYVERDYSDFRTGVNGSVVFNYNINSSLAVVLAPKYTYFFDPLFPRNEYNFQRLGVNLGVEWKF